MFVFIVAKGEGTLEVFDGRLVDRTNSIRTIQESRLGLKINDSSDVRYFG